MKYAVVSDIHAHLWSSFSHTNSDGVNSRLRIILNELERAADELVKVGGRTMIVAGDIFHMRGSIDPEVLNPVRETFENILSSDIDIYVIAGNHDLKSDDSKWLSSSVANLSQVSLSGGVLKVFDKPDRIEIEGQKIGMVPWRNKIVDLLADLTELAKTPGHDQAHIFIHAGIDGVLSGMPEHGLTAKQLVSFGFKKVLAGHYHNHKDLGDGIYSIGATTHQTWGDVNTRAGFLIVDGDDVTFHDTKAPKFVDLTGLDEIEMETEAGGNYVRFQGPPMTQDEINDLRKQFLDWGALGVMLQVPRSVVSARTTPASSGITMEKSIETFVDGATMPASVDRDRVKKRALQVLLDAQTVVEEA